MIIKKDKEGIAVIQQLCDIALKQGGLQNLQAINKTLASVSEIKAEETKEKV